MSSSATPQPRPTGIPRGPELTTSDLLTQVGGGPRVVSEARRVLMVGGLPVATLASDPARINPLCARSAAGMPVIEMLAAIASQDPTGVLAIESANGHSGFAFNVHRGRVVSAKGPGELGQLEHWCAAVHQRFPERFNCAPDDADRGADPSWIRVAKTFVGERALDHLELALQPGVQLTFVRGDVEWIGTSLVHESAPSLSHLLLEHARRCDERSRLLEQLGSLGQIVVPLSEPAAAPTARASKGEQSRDDDDWDFFDDPDPAALQEWSDVRAMWQICNGQYSIQEAVEYSMLGRFRALSAMATLAARQHIAIAKTETASESDEGRAVSLILDDDTDLGGEVVEFRSSQPSRSPPVVVAASPRATKPERSAATSYALSRTSTGLASMPIARRSQRQRTPVRTTNLLARPVVSIPAVSAVATETAETAAPACPVLVNRDDTEPRPSSSLSMLAMQTVRSAKVNPNVRVIAMALFAAGLFVAGAAAALTIAQAASPAPSVAQP